MKVPDFMDFVIIYFLDPRINEKGKKKIKKIIGRKYIYIYKKKMALWHQTNDQKLVKEVQKIQGFDNIFSTDESLVDKENSI
jgi:hypothetical protein